MTLFSPGTYLWGGAKGGDHPPPLNPYLRNRLYMRYTLQIFFNAYDYITKSNELTILIFYKNFGYKIRMSD